MNKNFRVSALLAAVALGSASYSFAQTRNFELGVQAMIDKAGTTDVYLTAKPLDSMGAPTSFKQVQMKSFDKAGTLRWTKNLSDVPASGNPAVATLSYTDMQRQQPVQAQVLIQTSETIKTEVYKDKIPVLLRPDLTVSQLTAPQTVQVGQPFAVNAVIAELNGDLGAKNIKISLMDGNTVVDSIDTVQVSKHGQTTAVLKAKLMQPGTYTLNAQINSSAPADYDTTNNSKTVTVKVEDPKNLDSYSYLWHYLNDYTWSYKGVNTFYDQAWDQAGYQRYGATGIYSSPTVSASAELKFPFKLDYFLKYNDATTITSATGLEVAYQYTWTGADSCGGAYSESWGYVSPAANVDAWVSAWSWCGYHYSYAGVQAHHTEYVYYSKSWRPSTGEVFWNYNADYKSGVAPSGVTSVQGKLIATDANGVKYGVSAGANLNVATYPYTYDSGLQTHDWGWHHYKYDGTYQGNSTYVYGRPE